MWVMSAGGCDCGRAIARISKARRMKSLMRVEGITKVSIVSAVIQYLRGCFSALMADQKHVMTTTSQYTFTLY